MMIEEIMSFYFNCEVFFNFVAFKKVFVTNNDVASAMK